MNKELLEENKKAEEIREQALELNSYTLNATEVDMRTIHTIFGAEILTALNDKDPFKKIDAGINTLFASSHVLFRMSLLLKEAIKTNDVIPKKLNSMALALAKAGKVLLDKNEASFEEGIFNELTDEDIEPIIKILDSIEVDLPEGL